MVSPRNTTSVVIHFVLSLFLLVHFTTASNYDPDRQYSPEPSYQPPASPPPYNVQLQAVEVLAHVQPSRGRDRGDRRTRNAVGSASNKSLHSRRPLIRIRLAYDVPLRASDRDASGRASGAKSATRRVITGVQLGELVPELKPDTYRQRVQAGKGGAFDIFMAWYNGPDDLMIGVQEIDGMAPYGRVWKVDLNGYLYSTNMKEMEETKAKPGTPGSKSAASTDGYNVQFKTHREDADSLPQFEIW